MQARWLFRAGLLQTARLAPAAVGGSPTLGQSHHSLRCHLTPPCDDVGCHGASRWDPTPHKSNRIISHCTYVQKGVHVRSVPALSPLWGRVWRVLGRTCLDGCFREFWPETVDPSRAALNLPPAQTLPCVSQMHFQTSVKWKAEGWGGALGSVGGSCSLPTMETT